MSQTYRNFEIFISDNSTEDDTENLMQDYLQKYPNIKYFRHKDFTANDNWNFARQYNNPDAEFVNWLLDDDFFYPQKLEKMTEVMRNNPNVSLVTSVRNVIDENGQVTGRLLMPRPAILNDDIILKGENAGRLMFEIGKNYIGEPTTPLIRKKALRNGYDLCLSDDESGFFALVDIATWLQVLSQGDLFYIANEPLSAFRKHSEQASNWQGVGVIFENSWAHLYKLTWEKKIFMKDEKYLRMRLLNWIYSACLRLIYADSVNYHSEAVTTLEKTMNAVVQSLCNGYKIDLPPRYYGEMTEKGMIS